MIHAARLRIARLLRAIEPWYHWGETSVLRINTHRRDFADESEGPGWQFEIQWFGFHLGITVGRTPPAASPAVIQSRIAWRERDAANQHREFAL